MNQNKGKRRTKGIMGMILSLILAFTMLPMSAFAAGNNGTVSVSNIETGATVKAYQIITQDSDGNWVNVEGVNIDDPKAPTASEITAIATQADSLGDGIILKEGDITSTEDGVSFATYSESGLSAGMYLVLVEKANNVYVYNPVIVSVNYDYEGENVELKGDTVDASGSFTIGENTAYAKRSKPSLNKEITGKEANENVSGDATNSGDTHKVGDSVSFKIETTIPAYSDAYTNATFVISDTVSDGLDAPKNIVVKEGNATLDASNYTLEQNGRTFTITFKKDYLLSGFAKNITVTYDSEINSNATSGFDANTNTATIEYSNSPDSTTSKEEKTYHYTFDIDGNVFGTMTGREIVKVGVDEASGDLITKETASSTSSPLEGAEFQLLASDKETVVKETSSSSEGLLTFRGLDAGTYYLKETKAPTGYSTNSTLIPVEISATLNADGTLASYSVTINGENTTTYTWQNDGETPTVDKTGDTSLFNNYKAGLLPSTGGNGIYFYIFVGILLMGIAITVYVVNRRKEAKKMI